MKERPLLFSAPMVRAILAGAKTQTRRVVKPQPHDIPQIGGIAHHIGGSKWQSGLPLPYLCPYGKRGDRLYVKESIRRIGEPTGDERWCESEYIADGTRTAADCWPWKNKALPSIHCPRGLSRITLEIVSVRVERLQAISAADALAEGVNVHPDHHDKPLGHICSPVRAYRDVWEAINGPETWELNPWVWVVEFRRVPA